jgi:hypothetical protein
MKRTITTSASAVRPTGSARAVSSPPGTSRAGGTLAGRRLTLAAVVISAVITLMTTTGSASAATAASGCFTYQGAGVPGLTTSLEYHARSGWLPLGAPNTTGSSGCVRYTINGSWRNLHVRIVAGARLRDGQTVAWAASPYYAEAGYGRYGLGTRALTFYRAPDGDLWNVTGTWLAEMDHPSCNDSAAMRVACYMDANGMVGNPISFPDSDGDGTWDLADNWPFNPGYR